MSRNSEIPCTNCKNWDSKEKSLSCNPNKCKKLTEWLLSHAQIELVESMQVDVAPIQYVV